MEPRGFGPRRTLVRCGYEPRADPIKKRTPPPEPTAGPGSRLYDRPAMHARIGLAVTLSLVLALAGCTSTPTATPTPAATLGASPAANPSAAATEPAPSATPADPAAVYGAIAAQVEHIRGLQPNADVTPVVIDQATLTKNLTADFDRSNPASAIAHSQAELITLGLLPPGTDLRAAVLAFQSGQVLGYYSPEEHKLFVVSRAGGIGPTQRLTYSHEFTHELQDQHFDLKSLGLDAQDQGDRSLARLSLVEGDAVSVQYAWMATALSQEELGQVLAESLDPAGLAALNAAPPILRETSLFPYTAGLSFVQQLLGTTGYPAVDAAFASPPDSTEQILHPEKYAAHEAPVEVTPAKDLGSHLGSGWSEVALDTLGEEFLRVWLNQHGSANAYAAAAGWGGDRLVLLSGPAGANVVVLETVWDTPTDATEFGAAVGTFSATLSATVVHTAGSSRVSIAIGPGAAKLAAVLPG